MSAQVSVIIPFYNAKKYFFRCLRNLQKQTMFNFEAILVDDGSNDSSVDIARQAVQADERFKLIRQDNAGVSAARNNGIKHATSDLITFIDSDDWVNPNYLSNLLQQIRTFNSDIAITSYQLCNMVGYAYPNAFRDYKSPNDVYTPKEWLSIDLFLRRTVISSVVWGKLFKKELFDHVQFPTTVRTHEDELTFLRLCLLAKKISFANDFDYIYYCNPASLTTTPLAPEEEIRQLKLAIHVYEEKISTFAILGIDSTYPRETLLKFLKQLCTKAKMIDDLEDYRQANSLLLAIKANLPQHDH